MHKRWESEPELKEEYPTFKEYAINHGYEEVVKYENSVEPLKREDIIKNWETFQKHLSAYKFYKAMYKEHFEMILKKFDHLSIFDHLKQKGVDDTVVLAIHKIMFFNVDAMPILDWFDNIITKEEQEQLEEFLKEF